MFTLFCGLASGRFGGRFLVQMFGGDPLIQAVLGIDRLELDYFGPFFSRLFFLSQRFKSFSVFGVVDDPIRVEFDRFLELSDRRLS
jgi:hypothetical protein